MFLGRIDLNGRENSNAFKKFYEGKIPVKLCKTFSERLTFKILIWGVGIEGSCCSYVIFSSIYHSKDR